MNKISIFLPAFNEELTIEKTISDFYKELPEAFIYVINNNSTDKTESIARKIYKEKKIKGDILFESLRGKANAIRIALRKIDSEIYVFCDADSTYPANEIKNLIEPLENSECDMCVGDRNAKDSYKNENKRPLHFFGNKLVNFIINLLYKSDLKDVMSGYRAMKKEFIKSYPLNVEGFEIETDLTLFALNNKYIISEIPIEYKDRQENSFSKLNTFSDGAKIINLIFQTMRFYKPMLFFTSVSIFLIALSLLISVPVFTEFFSTGVIKSIPSAILSASLIIISFFCIFTGLILDSLNKILMNKNQ